MEIALNSLYKKKYVCYRQDFIKITKYCFKLLNIKNNYEIDVSFVDEQTIQEINKKYRNIDKITDVISFAFNDDKDLKHQIISKKIPILLGEIFICLPKAKTQAQEIGNSFQREIRFLYTHGLLHLLGYDHLNKKDEEIMFNLQDTILNGVFNYGQK